MDLRRSVVFRDMDFPGQDLQSIFDTRFAACESACFAREDCRAFTFNSNKGACFLKSGAAEEVPFGGALSALVYTRSAADLALAEARAAEVDFLTSRDIAAAREYARELAREYMAGGWDRDELVAYSRDAEAEASLVVAKRYMASAVVVGDRPEDWADLARLASAVALADSNSQTRKYHKEGFNAAVMAYLRGAAPGVPMAVMARALEARGDGRDSVFAWRMAVQDAPEFAPDLARAEAMFGFRVTDSFVDSDSAEPRICAVFSEELARGGVDYAPFVASDAKGLAVEARGSQLCLTGVSHGSRYRFTLRSGLPSAAGETLSKPVELIQYVRDRQPSVHFPGQAYVLPAGPDAGVPVVTVNTALLELELFRVTDRNLLRSLQDGYFAERISRYDIDYFTDRIGPEVWRGEVSATLDLNREVTMRLPVGEVIGDQPPGLYALRASVPRTDENDVPPATQWFVISDIGVTTMQGADGLHVFLRALSDAQALEGAELTLLSGNNAQLGTALSDARGYAQFAAGATAGQGGDAPAMLMARVGDDMTFLALDGAAFDLSDRGVEGHPAAPPIDVFLTTDRGAYRAGETVYTTALARDGQGRALSDLALTLVVSRPDGVEHARIVSNEGRAGGYVFETALSKAAQRGTWRLEAFVDPDAPALASVAFLVEDFLPERIDFDLALGGEEFVPNAQNRLNVAARYLFGAKAADLYTEASLTIVAADAVEGWPGYAFGAYDAPFEPIFGEAVSGVTDADGAAELLLSAPVPADVGRPLQAVVSADVQEGSGRPVTRQLRVPVAASGPMLGIRPGFDDVLPEGGEAAFDLIALGPDGEVQAMDVRWEINRVQTRYQWFRASGDWQWQPVTTRKRVASGDARLGTEPVRVAAPVDWGRYEIVVSRKGGAYLESSYDFYAGWYAPADATQTPDVLEVSLDREAYAPGDTAQLRFVPRAAGKALVTVMSNRLIDMVAVDAVPGENLLDLPVSEDWGAGAYVTVQVVRPLAGEAVRAPVRALGLAHAGVDPGARLMAVEIDAPEEMRPDGPLEAVIRVPGAQGEVFASVAAVDLGILNLTGFTAPDPADHYFGQRRLGLDLRDLYGRLIDGQAGAMGALRSGGDAMAQLRMQAPPPQGELMARFSGPIALTNGEARVSFDLPDFDGTVRLMAVVWSDDAVGGAARDVEIADPVVITASLPRFLSPGDTSEARIELVHRAGEGGDVEVSLRGAGIEVDGGTFTETVSVAPGARRVLSVPITARASGLAELVLTTALPDGSQRERVLPLDIRRLDPPVVLQDWLTLDPGRSLVLPRDFTMGLDPEGLKVTLALGDFARMDVSAAEARLQRPAYGATEAIIARAFPTLDGFAGADVPQAVGELLARQGGNGGFGAWYAGNGELWLEAYATDFLTRARGFVQVVPELALRAALGNLGNRVNYHPEFDSGGEGLAYALYVLAREGAASMGDLRYYADVKGEALATPLAAAHLGAALAAYGDQPRADKLFARAGAMLADEVKESGWRDDYGTGRRDAAGVLALALEAGSQAVDRAALVDRIGGRTTSYSVQEASWVLRAAAQMRDSAPEVRLGGVATREMVIDVDPAALVDGLRVENPGKANLSLILSARGVPIYPGPAYNDGYAISRALFDFEGNPVSGDAIAQGERLVVVLTVEPYGPMDAQLLLLDPLPAGFEFDGGSLLRNGDVAALDWLDLSNIAQATVFLPDRFAASVRWSSKSPLRFAYLVCAVTPGDYAHAAPSVENRYRPSRFAVGEAGRVVIRQQ